MTPNKVAILNHHRIVPDGNETRFHDIGTSRFRAQMQLLAARCQDVTDGAIRLRDGMTAYVTFDDGTEDHMSAGELLADLGLIGVFLVVTGRLDSRGTFPH